MNGEERKGKKKQSSGLGLSFVFLVSDVTSGFLQRGERFGQPRIAARRILHLSRHRRQLMRQILSKNIS